MADVAHASPDTRPGLVICAWEPAEMAWDPIEDLSGEPWNPAGARTDPLAADEPGPLADALITRLADPRRRALLLVGRTRNGDSFRLQIRAENRTIDGTGRLDDSGPAVVRTTAPAAEMVQALRDAGLAAEATSEAEGDAGSYLLYRVLSALPDEADAPAVGLLRAPLSASDAAVQRGVKAAAQAMARHLSPLPRSRPT